MPILLQPIHIDIIQILDAVMIILETILERIDYIVEELKGMAV